MKTLVHYKWDSISLINIYRDPLGQQKFISICKGMTTKDDIFGLQKTLYGIQRGMDQLVKDKLLDTKMRETFSYMVRIVEKGIQHIWRRKHPCILDNGKLAREMRKRLPEQYKIEYAKKKERDHALEKYLRKNSF